MVDNKFTWVTFFKEVQEKIHNNYTSKQLANIANKIFGRIKDIDDYGNEVPIQEMTPINFIGYFNRRLSLRNRIQYCQKLKEIMNLTSETPVDFDGIPEFNNQNCLCMPFKKDRAAYIVQEQWEISKQILNDNINIKLFDKILSNAHPYIGLSYLSRFCFIVKPEKYYPYDKQMAINLKAKMPETYKGYNDYCKLLKYTYPEKTSYELSYEAFMENNNKQYKKQTNQKKYWLYSAGEKSYKWDEFYKDGIMAIGWDYLGDLTKYSSQEEIADKITKEENKTQYPMNDSKANWEFAKDMQVGDIVYVKKGLQDALIGRGIVKSDYIYDANRNEYKSIRKVEWTHNGIYDVDFKVLDIKQWNQKTLTDISENKYKDFCKKIEKIFNNNAKEDKNMNSQPLNQILYGPPGTGKTYNTIIKAMDIINPKLVQRDKDGNVEKYDTLKNKFDELKQQGQIEFVTFHQSYSYEEFVEGIKPDLESNELKYKLEDGIFKKICNSAKINIEGDFEKIYSQFIEEIDENHEFKTQKGSFKIRVNDNDGLTIRTGDNFEKETCGTITKEQIKNQTFTSIGRKQKLEAITKYLKEKYGLTFSASNTVKPHILIIDEINRGDVSKIFGELITLIEEDKRIGKEHQMTVTLPYSREPFGVPNNLYIIGTMNTADRSIALLDTALRRRFDFEEMIPKPELLRGKDIEGVDLEQLLTKINDRIKNEYDRDHQIGHSYLMSVKDKEDLERAYKNRILPLLNEYFYNDINTVAKILNCKSDEITSKENWFNVLKEAQKPTKKENEQ